jgi:hypothetical protein
MKPCHYFPIDARNEFYNGVYSKLPNLHFEFIHYYNPCMSSYNLGNSLGNYLNEISCAASTNTSLIIGKKVWDFPTMPYEYKGRAKGPIGNAPQLAAHAMALFEALPELFDSSDSYLSKVLDSENGTHGNVDPKLLRDLATELVQKTKGICPCDKYCWSDKHAPWVHNHQ